MISEAAQSRSPSEEQVKLLFQQKNEELLRLTSEMESLKSRLARVAEERELLKRLYDLATRGENLPEVASIKEVQREDHVKDKTLEEHLEDLLRRNGIPTHISEIRNSLLAAGIALPGRGDEANIILRLRRDQTKFVRTGRGMYALASFGLPNVPPSRRRKRRASRRSK